MQNQQKATSGLGEIGQNENLGSKRTNFAQKKGQKKCEKVFCENKITKINQVKKVKKGPKMGEKVFCQNFHWLILVINHNSSLNMQKQQNPLIRLGEMG